MYVHPYAHACVCARDVHVCAREVPVCAGVCLCTCVRAHVCACTCMCVHRPRACPHPSGTGAPSGGSPSLLGELLSPRGWGTVTHPLACARPGVEHPRCTWIQDGCRQRRAWPWRCGETRDGGVPTPTPPNPPPSPLLWGRRVQQGRGARARAPSRPRAPRHVSQ